MVDYFPVCWLMLGQARFFNEKSPMTLTRQQPGPGIEMTSSPTALETLAEEATRFSKNIAEPSPISTEVGVGW